MTTGDHKSTASCIYLGFGMLESRLIIAFGNTFNVYKGHNLPVRIHLAAQLQNRACAKEVA